MIRRFSWGDSRSLGQVSRAQAFLVAMFLGGAVLTAGPTLVVFVGFESSFGAIVSLLLALGWWWGIPLFVLSGVTLWLEPRPVQRQAGPLALGIAIGANAVVGAWSIGFFSVPRDASIRPMATAAYQLEIALVCFLAVALLASYSIWRERRLVLPLFAASLAVESVLLGGQLLRLAARLNGFTLSE